MSRCMTWVRHNGQAEMRDNVRTALKDAGLTQSEAAKRAGIKYTSLVGFLGANNWLKREDAHDLAEVVGLSLDGLVGGSIFKGETDRYDEFDHYPPGVEEEREERARQWRDEKEQQTAELAAGRTRAICCDCGALRTCASNRHRWEPDPHSEWRPRDGHRVTEQLRCFECREVTTHAVLLTADTRDQAEDADRAPSMLAVAQQELGRELERLREFNVAVTYRRGYAKRKEDADVFYACGYEFNDNTMQWEISLDENMAPRLQVEMLRDYWRRISSDDHGVDWDARNGVWTSPGNATWNKVADDLVTDISRRLHVERTRMLLDLQDNIGLHAEVEQQ